MDSDDDRADERALDQMTALIAGTSADQLSLPTPCSDWDVAALLQHVIGGMQRFAAMAAGERVDWSSAQPVVLGEDPAAAYRAGRLALEAAYAAHPESVARVRPTHLIETAVHAWDLAHATGREPDLQPEVAAAALALAHERLTPEARSRTTAFGQPVPAVADATVYEQLAAFLGRRATPGVDA
ncbi:MAG: TIGR03086 family metal-binding protein [Candidatus Dormiibacterota bacterium]